MIFHSLTDYLTKPLSGDKFKQFRNKIMNLKEFRLVQLGKPSVGDLTTMPILKKAKYSDESSMIQMKGSPTNMHNGIAEYASLNRSGKGTMIPTKSLVNKGVQEWSRVDKNRRCFLTTWAGGPKWTDVICRTTYDMKSGKIIEHLIVDDHTNAAVLHRKLPKGINWIKTVLLYRTE